MALNPCTAGADPICKVQMIMSPEGDAQDFGWAVLGMVSIEESQGESFDELVVSDPHYNSDQGRAYLYKGTPLGLNPVKLQTLIPDTGTNEFGYNLSHLGDVNGDGYSDIAVTAPGNGLGYVFVFYGGNVNSVPSATGGFWGPTSTSTTDYWTSAPASRVNVKHSDPAQPWPQIIRPTSLISTDGFGYGVSSAGDFNLDGFEDILINVAKGNYNLDVNLTQTGYYLMFFGSNLGLQLASAPTVSPKCHGGTAPVCDTFQIYLPNRENYEQSSLTSTPIGDFNGDGVTDLLLGGIGRTHPSGLAFSVGVFYVVY